MSDCEFELKVNNEEIEAINEKVFLAMEKCGEVAEGYAKDKCPVDTGALRNSIAHKVFQDGSDVECHIGTNMEYAPYIEFGTGQFAERGGRQTPWVYQDSKGKWHMTNGNKPRHFLKKAVADHAEKYRKLIAQVLKG